MGANQSVVEFTSSFTSVTVSRGQAGNLIAQINVEGSSAAYGPFVGTVTVTGANKGGSWHYEAFAMPADGSRVTGTADGSYESLGPTSWRTIGSGKIESDTAIQNLRLDAVFDFGKHSWNGTLTPI